MNRRPSGTKSVRRTGCGAELLFGDLALARRLEFAEAKNAAGFAEAWTRRRSRSVVPVLSIAGGQAAFTGVGSPLSHAIGMGMSGPVSDSQLDQLEDFFESRGAAVTLDVCPLADPSLHELLGRRAYRVVEFNNVLVRTTEAPGLVELPANVRRAEPKDQDAWARAVCAGFFEREEMSAEELELTGVLFDLRTGTAWLAEHEGRAVAAAEMAIQDGVAFLFGDATVAAFRRRGLQSDLIRARLAYASEQSCELVTASTLPGGVSQHNYERLGFRVIYTKTIMSRE